MKKIVTIIPVILLVGLIITKSAYVEIDEFILIGFFISIALITMNVYLKRNGLKSKSNGMSVLLMCFLLFNTFSYFDLIIDHLLYFPVTVSDGISLSLGEKIREYNDDILLMSLFSILFFIAISILWNLIIMFKNFVLKKRSIKD